MLISNIKYENAIEKFIIEKSAEDPITVTLTSFW